MRQNSERGWRLKCLENFREAVVKWKTTAPAAFPRAADCTSSKSCEKAAVKTPVSRPGQGEPFGNNAAAHLPRAAVLLRRACLAVSLKL